METKKTLPGKHFPVDNVGLSRQDWMIPGLEKGPSYGNCQRVLAVMKLNGGIIESHGPRMSVTSRIGKLAAVPLNTNTTRSVLEVLEYKGLVILDRKHYDHQGQQRSNIYMAVLVNTEDTHVDQWAIDELRAAIVERTKQANGFDKPAEMPKDYQATPEYFRPAKQVIVYPAPSAEAVADEVDYGKLADNLLVKVMHKLAEQAKPPISVESLDEARRYAFNMEKELKAKTAQCMQLIENNKKLMERCDELGEQVEVLTQRMTKYYQNEEVKKQQSRSAQLKDVISPEAQKALEAMKRNSGAS